VIYGLYLSAAGMLVNQYRQDVIANNLANVETAGFKRDIPAFSERLIEARARLDALRHRTLDAMTGGVWASPTYTDLQPGPVEVTGNPLDVAIVGDGFFAVQTDAGVRYTRLGQFTLAADGTLVTASGGYSVLDEQGRPVVLPRDASTVRIAADGSVIADGRVVAKIGVVGFDGTQSLRKVGSALFASDAQPRQVAATLRCGAVEKSNVEPMLEMAAMIEASRAYQLNAQLVSLQDATLGRLMEIARPA